MLHQGVTRIEELIGVNAFCKAKYLISILSTILLFNYSQSILSFLNLQFLLAHSCVIKTEIPNPVYNPTTLSIFRQIHEA